MHHGLQMDLASTIELETFIVTTILEPKTSRKEFHPFPRNAQPAFRANKRRMQ